MIRFSCASCRRTFRAFTTRCPHCSEFRKSFRMASRVCGNCDAMQRGKPCFGCVELPRKCDTEKVWVGEIDCPRDRHHKPALLPRPTHPQRVPRFPRGRVGFLAVAYQPIGGTEVWHQTLLPQLADVSGFVALEPELAGGDFGLLGCTSGVGLDAARRLAAAVDVLVVWGVGAKLQSALQDIDSSARPAVVSVSHCDSRSQWTREMMTAQELWTDHCVYLCPSGRDTCPAEMPTTFIPNAPNPGRIVSAETRSQIRGRLGIDEDATLLVSVSRLSPEKQVAKLIQAIDHLPAHYRLVVAGTAAGWSQHHGDELRAMAGRRVTFVGNVDTPGDLLVAADAFASASDYEGYGLSMAEAVLAGVPLIATQTGLLESRPEFARLVDHNATAKDWAAAITADFADPAAQRQRATAAATQIDTIDQFVDSWSTLIERMANASR